MKMTQERAAHLVNQMFKARDLVKAMMPTTWKYATDEAERLIRIFMEEKKISSTEATLRLIEVLEHDGASPFEMALVLAAYVEMNDTKPEGG